MGSVDNAVALAFESYRREVMPKGASAIQVRECELAFFAGAQAVRAMYTMDPTYGDEFDERVGAVERELDVYGGAQESRPPARNEPKPAPMRDREPVYCADNSTISYPEVLPNVDRWLWSNDAVKGQILVTEDGLRRLLRFASKVWPTLMCTSLRDLPADMIEPWKRGLEKERLTELLNESSAIFCEGSLVMSRLFVSEDGRPVAHPDEEVDAAAVAAWKPANGVAGDETGKG